MVVEVKVEATQVLARFSPAGIPVQVRNNLRNAIPPLMRELTGMIDDNLSVLKSRTHLQLKGGPQGQMVENAQGITGRAEMTWTGDPNASMVPEVIESGSKPHAITAKNASVLAFEWPNAPAAIAALFPKTFPLVFFRQVMHPGFPGIHYMENAFNAMRPRIVADLTKAVNDGMQK